MGKILLDRKKLDYVMLMRDVPTYRDLAKAVDVHHNTLNNMVNHDKYSMGLLERVAEYLNVNPLDLLTTEGFPEPVLAADREWDKRFADPRGQSVLGDMAAKARAAHRRGETQPLVASEIQ